MRLIGKFAKDIELLDKYPVKYISRRLTIEYIDNALSNISELRNLALDSQPDVYSYINLIHRILVRLKTHIHTLILKIFLIIIMKGI